MGFGSFTAMLYLDYVYNAPSTSTLAHSLAAAVAARRARAARQRERDEARAAPPDDPGLDTSALAAMNEEEAEEEARAGEQTQRTRWHFLYTMWNNPGMRRRRVLPPPPMQPWELDDDALNPRK